MLQLRTRFPLLSCAAALAAWGALACSGADLTAGGGAGGGGGGGGGGGPTPSISHVVVVVEENTDYASVIGNSSMPYLNGLANQYALATQYYANTHPSIGNYFMMTTGKIETNDDTFGGTVSDDNIVRRLIAGGKTWKSYAEGLPSPGFTGGSSGRYARKHNPLSFFSDVTASAAQQQNLVPFSQFAGDLSGGQLPSYAFVVPDLCNDAHDCSLATADAWLKTNIDPLVQSASFQQDGLLIIVFDEAGGDNAHGGGRVPCVLVGPKVKRGFQSTTQYEHQSLLRLTAEALGVTPPGAAAAAPAMGEFFTP